MDRQRRVFFTREDDLDLVGLAVNENPFRDSSSSHRWSSIANVLKETRKKQFTPKNVRERLNHLISRFKGRCPKVQVTSGKEERYDKLDQLINDAGDLKQQVQRNPAMKLKILKKELDLEGERLREESPLKVIPFSDDKIKFELLKCETNPVAGPPSSFPAGYHNDDERSGSESLVSLQYDSEAQLNPLADTPSRYDDNTTEAASSGIARARKVLKRKTMEQRMWAKEEQEYKQQVLAVEKMKAENERMKLEIERKKNDLEHDLSTKKLKLQQDEMALMQGHMDQTRQFIETMARLMEKLVDRCVAK